MTDVIWRVGKCTIFEQITYLACSLQCLPLAPGGCCLEATGHHMDQLSILRALALKYVLHRSANPAYPISPHDMYGHLPQWTCPLDEPCMPGTTALHISTVDVVHAHMLCNYMFSWLPCRSGTSHLQVPHGKVQCICVGKGGQQAALMCQIVHNQPVTCTQHCALVSVRPVWQTTYCRFCCDRLTM